jgi:hypothetical protein
VDNNKLYVAFAILAIVVLIGLYSGYYAYSVNNLQPDDLKSFESDLNNISKSKIPEASIKAMENLVNQTESGTAITVISESELKNVSSTIMPNETTKANFQQLKNNIEKNQGIANRYDLLLQGELATSIRTAYSTEMAQTITGILNTQEKVANDLANGNNTAFVADMKQYIVLAKNYNQQITTAHAALEKIVNQMS